MIEPRIFVLDFLLLGIHYFLRKWRWLTIAPFERNLGGLFFDGLLLEGSPSMVFSVGGGGTRGGT